MTNTSTTKRSLSDMMSPPQRTPSKPSSTTIIDLDSSSPVQAQQPSASTSKVAAPLVPDLPPHPFWSNPQSPAGNLRPRAQPIYTSPSCRSALSPKKTRPFHESPIHPSFLDKGKQPDFTSRRGERIAVGEMLVYPLHNSPGRSPRKKSEAGRKRFKPREEERAEQEKENVPSAAATTSVETASAPRVVIGKGKGKETMKEFTLKDEELLGEGKKPPMVVYSRCKEEVDELVGCLRGPLSFDMEWPISRRKGQECKTALIQIGDSKIIVLAQISSMFYRIPPKLLKILLDPKVIKLGVNIRGDALKLRRDFGHKMRGFLEVSHMARSLDPLSTGPGKAIISLQNLTAHYLLRHLPKPALRTGDWTAALSKEAITYAAADVLSALLIFRKLLAIMERDEEENKDGWEGPRGLEERRMGWSGDLVKEEEEERAKEKERLRVEKEGE